MGFCVRCFIHPVGLVLGSHFYDTSIRVFSVWCEIFDKTWTRVHRTRAQGTHIQLYWYTFMRTNTHRHTNTQTCTLHIHTHVLTVCSRLYKAKQPIHLSHPRAKHTLHTCVLMSTSFRAPRVYCVPSTPIRFGYILVFMFEFWKCQILPITISYFAHLPLCHIISYLYPPFNTRELSPPWTHIAYYICSCVNTSQHEIDMSTSLEV